MRTPEEIAVTGAAWVTEAELVDLVSQINHYKGALEAIASGDYQGQKLWEHKLAADALKYKDGFEGSHL